MTTETYLFLADIEQRVCDIAVEQLGITRREATPRARIVEDLHCDSLDLVEFLMSIEVAFGVTLPDVAPNPVYKAVFTRQPFRLSDLAELVYLQQGTGTPERKLWRRAADPLLACSSVPFTQLGGRWQHPENNKHSLFERLKDGGPLPQYRRRSDGMRCVLIPEATVEIGCNAPDAAVDEKPLHIVHLDAFLIDAEPVSTTAYCRFLNSLGAVYPEVLQDWFVLDADDDRQEHVLLTNVNGEWHPKPGTEHWPMVLVSWYGANAYSLWANGRNHQQYRDEPGSEPESFLPTEAQWEYAARGVRYQCFPWGDRVPTQDRMRFGQHRRTMTYGADALPMADVNEQLGLSPFGLHHMAGNVWQWCRDWYDAAFYQRAESTESNPVNQMPTQVRSERGGSWVGPAGLCRSSFRRGRPPLARGRCLGFRCVSSSKDVSCS
jgi:acyl carrier protein